MNGGPCPGSPNTLLDLVTGNGSLDFRLAVFRDIDSNRLIRVVPPTRPVWAFRWAPPVLPLRLELHSYSVEQLPKLKSDVDRVLGKIPAEKSLDDRFGPSQVGGLFGRHAAVENLGQLKLRDTFPEALVNIYTKIGVGLT